jgi:hypothetical protein
VDAKPAFKGARALFAALHPALEAPFGCSTFTSNLIDRFAPGTRIHFTGPEIFGWNSQIIRQPMKIKSSQLGIAFAAMLMAAAPANAGGRYPMYLSQVQGSVEVRLDKPGSRWQKPKLGALEGGTYLLRTGPRSYAHLNGKFRCVDSNSLIRINFDSEASIDVLRGQMSAVDGKRGKSLPDNVR